MLLVIATTLLTSTAPALEVGQSTRPICAIDMGSNSFRRIVGMFHDGRYDQRALDVVSLGVGDDVTRHGRISDPKIGEIERTLQRFKAACDHDAAGPVVAVGTAAFRDAANGKVVIQVAARHGIKMEIASEARESELAYLAGALGAEGVAVIDNGSRSIELVSSAANRLQYRVATLGYRVAFDEFFAKAADVESAAAAFCARLNREAAQALFMRGRKKLVGIEFHEMADILFGERDVEGKRFTRRELEARLKDIAASGRDGFTRLKNREDIDRALPRLVAAVCLMELFGYDAIELTHRELGTGLIIEAGRTRQ